MAKGKHIFTSESVSEGHPDKVADQISDALVDAYLAGDPNSHVACETLVTTDFVCVAGEVTSQTEVDIEKVVRDTIRNIGYTKDEYGFNADTVQVLVKVHPQSPDIARGVNRDSLLNQGAGDQGIMFGYATNESPDYLPLTLSLSHKLVKILSDIRHTEPDTMPYLRPDAKSQVSIEYDNSGKPVRIDTIVVSTQHDEFDPDDEVMRLRIECDVRNIVIPRLMASLPEGIRKLFDGQYTLYVNPTGKFVIGGPAGDTGLTGRKIIVDTYGGKAAHGGGAFSSKTPDKVDRSAAYAARHIAKNLVAAGVCDKCQIQVAYAIGVARPVSVCVNTKGTAHVPLADCEIAKVVLKLYDLRPGAIIDSLGLKNPIYLPTAAYGHFGRESFIKDGITFFPWEKTDLVPFFRDAFNIPDGN